MPVLAVKTGAGAIKAVLFGYACHNTVLGDLLRTGPVPAGVRSGRLARSFGGARSSRGLRTPLRTLTDTSRIGDHDRSAGGLRKDGPDGAFDPYVILGLVEDLFLFTLYLEGAAECCPSSSGTKRTSQVKYEGTNLLLRQAPK